MSRTEEFPLDPQIADALDALDATLAGEPVSPDHAELAELALLLVADRPALSSELVTRLDDRVTGRFASSPAAKAPRHLGRWWLWTPAAGLAAALAAAIVIVLAGGSRPLANGSASIPASSTAKRELGAPARSPGYGSSRAAIAPGKSPASAGSPSHGAPSAGPASPTRTDALSALSQPTNTTAELTPPPNGRKIIQSGQLSLITASAHIDDVAQEIFVVVGQVGGIVNSSNVTASGGPGGYAQFQLSIPSGSLPQTMAALSNLHYARVSSRTDTTQDVNDQYQADVQRLADDRALRTSLLKQLANATTQAQIDSLTAQIHDAESAISSDQATLRGLNRQIAYSQVTVSINGGVVTPPLPATSGGGRGFTFGKAAHDAGRVLTVAAGVLLIGLAASVPIALVAALGWWIGAAIRRRRREQALDAV